MHRTSRRTALRRGLTVAAAAGMSVLMSTSVTACSNNSGSSAGATTAAGYTLTEVPGFGISLAIPTDWTTLTPDDLDDDALVNTVAEALGQDAESVRESAETFHLISVDADAEGFAENLVVSQYELEDALPPEEELAEVTADYQVDSSNYVQRETGSGADAVLYTASGTRGETGEDFAIALMAIATGSGPTSAAGATASPDAVITATFVLIEAASADRAQELADVVIGSV